MLKHPAKTFIGDMIKVPSEMAPVLFISSLRCKLDYLRMRVTRMTKSFFGC